MIFIETSTSAFVKADKDVPLTLRSEISLNTLSERSGSVVDVLSSSIRTDERNRFDSGFFAEEFDGRDGSVED